jgi:Tfp pilus assembly protein FimV
MTASITFTFETRDELNATLRAFLGQATVATSAPVSPMATADEPEKPKRGRPAKVDQVDQAEPAEPAKAEPTPEKTRKAALGDIVGSIRSFVLADKVGNMRKLIPLMPDGKKSLDSLDLEEAQSIALQLGLEVG